MKKLLLTLVTIFFAYYCAYITSGASEKQSLFGFGNSKFMYKIRCAISGETDTTDSKALFYRGQNHFDQNEYKLAIADMKKVISIDSSQVYAFLIIGKSYLGLGDTVSAINALLKDTEMHTDHGETFFEIGNIFKTRGMPDSSFYYYKKSLDANNNSAKSIYEIAMYFYKAKSYSDALEYIDKAITIDEYNLNYRNLRRLIYIQQNNQNLASQDYEFIKSQNSEFFGNYKEKAEQESNKGNYMAAVEYYKQALEEQVDNRELLEAKAWTYQKLGYYDSSLIDFKRVCELNPDYLSYFNVAYTLDILDKVKESIDNYDLSLNYKSEYYITYNNRGYEYYRLKNFKKAEEDYTKSIKLKDDYSLSYYNRGILYYDQKKYAKAIDDYQNALKYADKKQDLTYSLALAYDKFKKKDKAIDTYSEFIGLTGQEDSTRIAYAKERIEALQK